MLTVFLNMAFYSCTPTSISDDGQVSAEDCCGNEGEIPPPPPPPPGDGG